MDLSINIVNTDVSYTGEHIKDWCLFHNNNDNSEFSYHANELYHHYFSKYPIRQFPPSKKAYYFVWIEKDYMGFMRANLQRDEDKSPRRQR